MQADPGSMPRSDDSQDELSLALTLCARLCHDLAGTVGALAGTLELAAEGQDGDALALAVECAREVSARLRLLRAAWGANPDGCNLQGLTAGLPGAERLAIDLSGLAPGLAEAPGRLAANLLLLAAGSLPRGGSISLAGDNRTMLVEIAGPRAGWPAGLAACLADRTALRAACAHTRDVGLAVTCLVARQLGLVITLHGPLRLTVEP